MTTERRCATPSCTATLPATGPNSRRLYCAACRRARAVDARARFKERAGAAAPRIDGLQRRATLVWLCATLTHAGCCFCPERRIAALQLYRPHAKADELSIAEMISRGIALTRIQAAARDAVVICANCYTARLAIATKSYRHQYEQDVAAGQPPLLTYVGARVKRRRGRPSAPAAVVLAAAPAASATTPVVARAAAAAPSQPIGPQLKPRPPWARPPTSASTPPGVGVSPLAPVEHEGGDPAKVVVTEVIDSARTSNELPHVGRTDEPAPQQPTDGPTEVDVRDVPSAMAVGDPVRENAGGSRLDDAVDADREASVVPGGLHLGIRRRRDEVRR